MSKLLLDSEEEHLTSPQEAISAAASSEQWWSLASATLAMVSIGHCQYTWTLFVAPLQQAMGANPAEVQAGFSCFIGSQTGTVLLTGLLLPPGMQRMVMAAGALLLLFSLLGLSFASSLPALYGWCLLLGVAVGSIYNICVTSAVRSFPLRRGLAAGISAAGYGAGTLPTIGLISDSIDSHGHRVVLQILAILVAATVLLATCLMPRRSEYQLLVTSVVEPEVTLTAAMRKSSFWVLYCMLVLISAVGLVVTSQMEPIADAFGVPKSTLVMALQFDRILAAASRPLWGAISDRIGRENALGLAFGLQAAVLLIWSRLLSFSWAFVLCSGLSTFSWGEVRVVMPSPCIQQGADLYGSKHVSATYGALYTGKAVAAIFAGPLTSLLVEMSSWEVIILIMAAASLIDAWMALVLLKRIVIDEKAQLMASHNYNLGDAL